jgi:hypothetical protein
MEVNQNSAVRFCLRVIQLLNQFAALSNCAECVDQRQQLDSLLNQREDAPIGCTNRSGLDKALADVDWYVEVASQMAQAHLILTHDKLVTREDE